MDERTKKAFDFLQDATKQLIALATAILTFTLAFLKDLAKGADADARVILTWSWILLVVSAIAGLLVLLSLTGSLGRPDASLNIYRRSVRFLSGVQLVAFGGALVLALWFGVATSAPAT